MGLKFHKLEIDMYFVVRKCTLLELGALEGQSCHYVTSNSVWKRLDLSISSEATTRISSRNSVLSTPIKV